MEPPAEMANIQKKTPARKDRGNKRSEASPASGDVAPRGKGAGAVFRSGGVTIAGKCVTVSLMN